MRLFTIIIFMNCLFWTLTLQAEERHDADREQLRNLLSTIEVALNQADIKQLAAHLRDDVVVTFLNAEVARGIPAVHRYFEKTMSGQNALLAGYKTQAKISAPALFFDNIAIAYGTAKDEFTLRNGHMIPVNTLWSATLVKQSKQWKVAQLHFSGNLFDNSVLSSVEKSIFIVSAIAVLIGLLIGFFIGRAMSQKMSRKNV
ncbi:MAG: nuclear transport factor 2 family protein [Gammaproteobacteria bacterium]|nr:nuclear transport factor 2 family protein [Gammaproteobacteria bacterium]